MPLRILLITPKFYGIEKEMKLILERLGHEVIWFENKSLPLDYHGTKSKLRVLRRIYFFLFFPYVRHIRKELNRIDNIKFDVLFSINGHVICPYLFRILRNKNPELYSILYLWDSSAMYSWERELKLFNKVYTFDPVDSEKYKIEYKPNFFIKPVQNKTEKLKNDLFFIGKFSPVRFQVIEKIVEHSAGSEIRLNIKLWPAFKNTVHHRLLYKTLLKIKIKSSWMNDYILNYEAYDGLLDREYFLSECLSYESVQDEMHASNVILDLPFQGQRGYTHRLIEAIANGKKVITTNKNIIKESFYNPDQIKIIDVLNPVVSISWIREEVKFSGSRLSMNLEISEWLNSLIKRNIA